MTASNSKLGIVKKATHVLVKQDDVTALLAEEGVYDPDNENHTFKAALLVKMVGDMGTIALPPGGITVDSVELKDAIDDIRLSIIDFITGNPTGKNAIPTIGVDGFGNPLVKVMPNVVNLDDVTDDQDGTSVDISNFSDMSVMISTGTAGVDNATGKVIVEVSHDEVIWAPVSEQEFADEPGVVNVASIPAPWLFVRTRTVDLTAGEITTQICAKN
jgi:hypothetical protein